HVMWLPRDLIVNIPGHGRQKLNAAFAYGEDRLTLRTVRDLLKIPIHHYVRVTFWGFLVAVHRLRRGPPSGASAGPSTASAASPSTATTGTSTTTARPTAAARPMR